MTVSVYTNECLNVPYVPQSIYFNGLLNYLQKLEIEEIGEKGESEDTTDSRDVCSDIPFTNRIKLTHSRSLNRTEV